MNIKPQDEDILECFLYPKCCYMTPDMVDDGVLNEEISKFNQFIDTYMKDYMWHCDFPVFIPRTNKAQILDNVLQDRATPNESPILPYISLTLRYDEDVGDEWFTVFLIFKLTEVFEGLIARLVDSDGEFLLIEIADYLPSWAEPEVCHNCVYVLNGAINVINEKNLTTIDQLNALFQNPHKYKLSNEAQLAIRKRISIYPDEIKKRMHKARAFLPEKAASILIQEPGLIASAIRTIVHSDPIERKVCRAMRYFPPEQRTMVNLKMTKCLYAMVTHCRYTGDPRTGWNFPPTNSPKYNAHLLGIKIACGLEILVAQANQKLKEKVNISEEIDSEQWSAYMERLQTSNYFKGTLDGSKEKEKLISIAKNYLIDNPFSLVNRAKNSDVAMKILEAWKNVKTEDFEMHAQDEASLSPPDDDSWLNVDAEQLEAMLGQHWGSREKKGHNEPRNIKNEIKAFMNQSSDVDGVEFPGGAIRDGESRPDCDDSGKMDFDADVFDTALRDILDLVVPGGDGEFDGSSEGSLAGDDDEKGGEMDKYMRLLDSQLEMQITKDDSTPSSRFKDSIETNLVESMEEEAGGAGPAGNILGGPIRRLMHLHLQSPTTVPPDLQS